MSLSREQPLRCVPNRAPQPGPGRFVLDRGHFHLIVSWQEQRRTSQTTLPTWRGGPRHGHRSRVPLRRCGLGFHSRLPSVVSLLPHHGRAGRRVDSGLGCAGKVRWVRVPWQGGRDSTDTVRHRRAMIILASSKGNTAPRSRAWSKPTRTPPARSSTASTTSAWTARTLSRREAVPACSPPTTRPTSCQRPPPTPRGKPFTRWSIRTLAHHLTPDPDRPIRIGHETLRYLLHRHRITFQRTRTWRLPRPRRQAEPDRARHHPPHRPGPRLRRVRPPWVFAPPQGRTGPSRGHPEPHRGHLQAHPRHHLLPDATQSAPTPCGASTTAATARPAR
ncbi:hypothetical protein ABH917_000882 [Thermobifida halotolerans]